MTDPVSTAIDAPRLALGALTPAYQAAVDRARDEEWVTRIFDRDTTVWSTDERVQAAIAERLGWLDAPAHFLIRTAPLEGFGDGVVEEGFTTVVLAGMGGSSLAPDILHRTFGVQEGYLQLRILDSTDPAAVAATVDDLDPLRTLTIIASKSGTTTEPLAFLADTWARLDRALVTDVTAMKGTAAKVDVAAFKDRYGLSRKYAIPLLEWLDRERVTRRVGDARVIL